MITLCDFSSNHCATFQEFKTILHKLIVNENICI
jgi:hypothetical protein